MAMFISGDGFGGMKHEVHGIKKVAMKWADLTWVLFAILGLASASYGLTKLLAFSLH